MKTMVVGSRSITAFDLSAHIPPQTHLIISGGAAGVDTLAEHYADAHGISKLILRPNYARFGRAAPLKRNEEMVDLADLVLIVWDGLSRGSAHTLRYANKKGKQVCLLRVDP